MGEAQGVVVAIIDERAYATGFPEADWADLRRGCLIDFDRFGPVHYDGDPEGDVELLCRGD